MAVYTYPGYETGQGWTGNLGIGWEKIFKEALLGALGGFVGQTKTQVLVMLASSGVYS